MPHQSGPMRVEVAVMQFGEPYQIGEEARISDTDGVHVGIVGPDGELLVNLRLDPYQAMEIAQNMSAAAAQAHINAGKLAGKSTLAALASLPDLGKKN